MTSIRNPHHPPQYPTLTVRLPQYTIDWINEECTEYEMSKAEVVREALNLYYQTKYQPNH
jgi:Arc/MetJ-type ribon-helix-helix transcriptional regulator